MLLKVCFRMLLFLLLVTQVPALAGQAKSIYLVTPQSNKTTAKLLKSIELALPSSEVKLLDLSQDKLIDNDQAFYIAAGNKALDRILQRKIKAPVLTVFVSRVSYQQVVASHHLHGERQNMHVLYVDPAIEQQLALIKALFKNRSDTAVLLSEKTLFLKEPLVSAAKKLKINLNLATYEEGDNIFRTLKSVDKANALLALPDSSIYNRDTIRNIISASYRKGQFIIGYSKQFVDAGGLATVYYDTETLTELTTKTLQQLIQKQRVPEVIESDQFDITINTYVADSYDLLTPETDKARLAVKKILEDCCDK